MFQVPLATSSFHIPSEHFWKTIILYHDRPHLINRKLTAISQALFYLVNFNSSSIKIQDLLNRAAILYEMRKLPSLRKENIRKEFLINLLEPYDKKVTLEEVSVVDLKDSSNGVYISLRILFPRSKHCPKAIEIVTFDKEHNKAIFLAVSDSEKMLVAPPFPYEIELSTLHSLRINVSSFEDADTSHAEWLVDKLFTKFLKWIEYSDENKQSVHSLSLVEVDEYCLRYNELKSKYAEKLVQEWPKKSGTDPQKYVFEDIAIASYLICLWRNDNNVRFVDCGCGNGLLVYLLNQEGYEGFGLDVRRRPTWDIYPKNIKLQIKAVTPHSIFPESTWIIGNHSDELTPWIPVIALKSSPKTNYFVLPCCPYDFNGKKFIRCDTSVSAYSDYLKYIQDISNKCGFQTDIDKLRIPSTKRTCLVGVRKEHDAEILNQSLANVMDFVTTKTSDEVVQRSSIEKVRNCTKLERNLIVNIVKQCVNKLITEEEYIKKPSGELWNKGRPLQISLLAKQIEKDDLKKLKQECGGLQTLLRNHRYIFDVGKGTVQLRLPVSIEATTQYKDKPCWFFKYHPNGCLYNGEKCGYKHE